MAMVEMGTPRDFVDSTPLLGDPGDLRLRAREDGCLFFKGLLPPERVLQVRRDILGVCRAHGWLAEGSELMDGVATPSLTVVESRDPRWDAFYCDLLKVRAFHGLALHGALIAMLEKLFGEAVLPHSRNICRVVFPHTQEHSTPPHQDHLYIGGSDDTWTVWIPLGDCPVELGSLAVARGTHTVGLMETHEATGPGGRAVDLEEGTVWYGGDYDCGDLVVLHSFSVHQGRDNQTPDRLRLSVDYRYQPRSHPVREDSLLTHGNRLTGFVPILVETAQAPIVTF